MSILSLKKPAAAPAWLKAETRFLKQFLIPALFLEFIFTAATTNSSGGALGLFLSCLPGGIMVGYFARVLYSAGKNGRLHWTGYRD